MIRVKFLPNFRYITIHGIFQANVLKAIIETHQEIHTFIE